MPTTKVYIGETEINTLGTIPTIETTMERFANRKMIVTGDSITDFTVKATTNWHDYLKSWLHLKRVYNDGLSGSGITREGDAGEDGYYYRIDNADPNGWDNLYTAIPDFIIIMFSQNDRYNAAGNAQTLGNIADITDTGVTIDHSYYGNIRLLLEKLITKYPNIPIVCCSSIPRALSYGSVGWGYQNFVEAEKTVCEHFSIPWLDLYHNSGLRPWDTNFASTYMPDGIHPNAEGQKIMAYKIYEFVKQYL